MTDGRDDDLHADRAFRPGPPPELREPPRRSRALGMFVATFALAAFAGVVWYAYDQGLRRGTETTAPLIKADPRPTKLRPDQPGGLQVPNQDKLVYEAMRPGDAESPKVERLLPPPERPVAPPAPPPPPPIPQATPSAEAPVPPPAPAPIPPVQIPSGTVAAAPPPASPAPASPAPASPAPASPAPASPAPAQPAPAQPAAPADTGIPPARIVTPAPVASAPRPDAAPATAPAPARASPPIVAAAPTAAAPPPAAAAPAPAAKPAPVAPPAAGAFRIQLGALRDQAAAEAEWNRLKRRHADELGSLDHRIQSVDLGPGKGIFYRIQSSGVSEASAGAICASLKAKNQPCIVVRP